MTAANNMDCYATLEVPSTASQEQIRDAYKRAALRTHPDRVPSGSPERADRTRKFQQVNEAYYVLSNPTRRREYDARRKSTNFGGASTGDQTGPMPEPAGSPGAGNGTRGSSPWTAFFGLGSQGNGERKRKDFENDQFGDVFEEMLREEGMAEESGKPTGKFWSVIGGLSGGALGFIVANFTGMVAGAVAGNRLGSIRDAKGKSVYAVFQELPSDAKMQLLSQLAAKVLSHAVSA